MGWASATYIFDAAVNVATEYAPKVYLPTGEEVTPWETVREIVASMYQNLPLEDWDTQNESEYWADHLVHVMYRLGEVDAEEYVHYL